MRTYTDEKNANGQHKNIVGQVKKLTRGLIVDTQPEANGPTETKFHGSCEQMNGNDSPVRSVACPLGMFALLLVRSAFIVK